MSMTMATLATFKENPVANFFFFLLAMVAWRDKKNLHFLIIIVPTLKVHETENRFLWTEFCHKGYVSHLFLQFWNHLLVGRHVYIQCESNQLCGPNKKQRKQINWQIFLKHSGKEANKVHNDMYKMVVLFPIFNSKFYIAMKVLKRCGSFPDCSLQDTKLSSTLNPYSTLDCFFNVPNWQPGSWL